MTDKTKISEVVGAKIIVDSFAHGRPLDDPSSTPFPATASMLSREDFSELAYGGALVIFAGMVCWDPQSNFVREALSGGRAVVTVEATAEAYAERLYEQMYEAITASIPFVEFAPPSAETFNEPRQPPSECADCHGSGWIELFTSRNPCACRCG